MADEAPRPFIRYSDGSKHEGLTARADPGLLRRLDGRDLTVIGVNFQTRLQFDEFEVVIATRFLLRLTHSGGEYELDPEDRGSLAPLLTLYPDTLAHAVADSNAALHLNFASGATLTVPAHDRYEAWEVHGPGAFLVVGLPGRSGELAIWN